MGGGGETGTVRWNGVGGVADAMGDGAEIGALFGIAGAQLGGTAAGLNSASRAAATGNFTRALQAGDLGIQGTLREYAGHFPFRIALQLSE